MLQMPLKIQKSSSNFQKFQHIFKFFFLKLPSGISVSESSRIPQGSRIFWKDSDSLIPKTHNSRQIGLRYSTIRPILPLEVLNDSIPISPLNLQSRHLNALILRRHLLHSVIRDHNLIRRLAKRHTFHVLVRPVLMTLDLGHLDAVTQHHDALDL